MLLLLLLIAGAHAQQTASQCVAGEYHLVATPPALDACTNCSTNNPDEFSTDAIAQSGAACSTRKAATDCVVGEVFADSGVTTADSTCTPCNTATEFNTVKGAACSTRKVVTDCVIGEVFADSGVNTADSTCTTCPATTFNSVAGATCGAKIDEATKNCAAGTQYNAGSLATSDDTSCDPCTGNQYNANVGSGTCGAKTTEAVKACAAGTQYNAGSLATSDDTSCDACTAGAAGTHNAAAGSGTCTANTEFQTSDLNASHYCDPATHIVVQATLAANAQCNPFVAETACSAGQDLRDDQGDYTAQGSAVTVCTNCAAGKFKATDGATSGACGDKVKTAAACVAGEKFDAGSKTDDDDAKCENCGAAEFNDTAGSGTCTAHTKVVGNTPAGSKFVAGTLTADSNFVACAAGQFSAAGATACSDKTVTGACTAGQAFVAGDPNVVDQDDASCDPCDSNDYNTAAGDACVAWTDLAGSCGKGQDAVGGTPTTDNKCTDCLEGFFNAATTAGSCLPKPKSVQGGCQAFEKPNPGTAKDSDDSSCADRAAADCADGKEFTADSAGAGGTCGTCTNLSFCKAGVATVATIFQAVNDANPNYCDPASKKVVAATSSADATCVDWAKAADCLAGERLEDGNGAKTSTVDANSVCAACGPGKFKAAAGAGDCIDHAVKTADCDTAAKKVFTPGTTSADGTCEDEVVAPASSAAGVSLISIMIATFFAAAW